MTINLEPVVNPGYGYYGQSHVYIGTVYPNDKPTVSINCGYASKLSIRRYLCGLEPPNHPVPTTMGTIQYTLYRGKVLDIDLNCADNTTWWPEEQWSYDD